MYIQSNHLLHAPQFWGMDTTNKGNNTQELARYLYTKEGKTLKEIALTTGEEEGNIRVWVAQGGWEGMRVTLLTSKEHQLRQLFALLDQVNKKMTDAGEVNPKDADLAMKYTTAIRNLDVALGIPEIVDIASQFINWVRTKNRQLATAIAIEFDGFITGRAKNYQL